MTHQEADEIMEVIAAFEKERRAANVRFVISALIVTATVLVVLI